MKTLAVTILLCLTVVSVAVVTAGAEYLIEHERLEMQAQRLQLDILNAINNANEKAERELNKQQPGPKKPSLELPDLRG